VAASPAAPPKDGGVIDMAQQPDGSYAMGGGNALTGSAGAQPGTYGNATNPTYAAPEAYSYTADDYTASPAYQYTFDQAMRGAESSAANAGALRSGATLKALQDRASNLAYQDFSNERNFDYGKYIDSRNFGRSNYENDRNYLTQRYDRNTDDVFRYTGIGQNALNTTTNAVQGYGADAAQTHLALGDNAAQSALARGDIWSGLVSNAAGMASSYLSGLGSQNALNKNVKAGIAANPNLF
jgi:hypothetical protein